MIFSPTIFKKENKLNIRIARVVEVSYMTDHMRIVFIDVLDSPIFNAKAHYTPSVQTGFISAKYFLVGQIVFALTTSQGTYVFADASIGIYKTSHTFLVGSDIEHDDWMGKLNGGVFGNGILLCEDGTVAEFTGEIADPWTEEFSDKEYLQQSAYYQSCHWIRWGDGSFPCEVFPNDPIVHLEKWSWTRGEPNYFAVGDLDYLFTANPVSGYPPDGGNIYSYRGITEDSCLLPTEYPAIRLETQPVFEMDQQYQVHLDEFYIVPVHHQPGVQFFIYPPDAGIKPLIFSRSDNSDLINLLFTIERPWTNAGSPAHDYWTNNFFPAILKHPKQYNGYSKLHFGWIDYLKEDYDVGQGDSANLYTVVTGYIQATPKASASEKEYLGFDDYDLTYDYSTVTDDSYYDVVIHDTGSDNGTYREGNRQVKMLAPHAFRVCTDGINTLTKTPVLTFNQFKSYLITDPGPPEVGTYVNTWDIDIAIHHRINGAQAFTSSMTADNTGTVSEAVLYYLFQIDLVNKLIVAEKYIFNKALSTSEIQRVVIDVNDRTESIIWKYVPNTYTGSPANYPPWTGSSTFPAHPFDTGFTGSSLYTHTEWKWKQFYFSGTDFGAYIESCQHDSIHFAGSKGTNYPCDPADEDIHTVLLMTQFVDNGRQMPSYDFFWCKPRRDGWLAYARCCLDPTLGTITYPYSRGHIKKVNGVVSAAEKLYTGTVETINRVY